MPTKFMIALFQTRVKMNISPKINFLERLLENNPMQTYTSESLQEELKAFVEEFNNWLTANFVEEECTKWLIISPEELNLDNHFLERYTDSIRIYADYMKKPMRWFITNQLELAIYELACKRGDYDRIDASF